MCIDATNIDPKYWEKILSDAGMPSNLPSVTSELKRNGFGDVVSSEEFGATQLENQFHHDQAIVYENMYSGATPMNKSGLPPCKQKEEQISRSGNFDFSIE